MSSLVSVTYRTLTRVLTLFRAFLLLQYFGKRLVRSVALGTVRRWLALASATLTGC